MSDIPRKDRDKESGGHAANDHPVLRCHQQRCANEDLDNPREHHYEVGICREPVRNLRQKLTPGPRQMARASKGERCSEQKPERCLSTADLRLLTSHQKALEEPKHSETLYRLRHLGNNPRRPCVDAGDGAVVQIILNGVDITNTDGAAIAVMSAETAIVILGGTDSLAIFGNYNDGIASEDGLVIDGGEIEIAAGGTGTSEDARAIQ